MERDYWLIVRNDYGIIDIREAHWSYFFRKDGSFRSEIKSMLKAVVNNSESYEFGLKSSFEARGIVKGRDN